MHTYFQEIEQTIALNYVIQWLKEVLETVLLATPMTSNIKMPDNAIAHPAYELSNQI